MQVIELITNLDKLAEDAEIVLITDGIRYEDVVVIYDEDLNEVVFTERVTPPPSLEEEFKSGFDEARG